MSHGSDVFIVAGLCRKLRQLAQVASFDLLPAVSYNLGGQFGGFDRAMAPSSLVSLRGFRSGVDLPGPDPLRTASSHPIHPSLAHPATSSQWRGLNPHARTFVATRHLPPAAAAIAAVGGRSVQVSRRPLATVAMAEAAQPQPDAVQVGRLVEFSRGKSQSLGLVVAPTTPAGTWKVEDVS